MEIARDKAIPSQVEVPRPNSSIITNDLGVAVYKANKISNVFSILTCKIVAVSNISAIKVEMPRLILSPAPTRTRMASNTGNVAESQGTKKPH